MHLLRAETRSGNANKNCNRSGFERFRVQGSGLIFFNVRNQLSHHLRGDDEDRQVPTMHRHLQFKKRLTFWLY